MSVTICQTPAAPFHITTAHSSSTSTSSWLPPHKPAEQANSMAPTHVNIWSMIQSQNSARFPTPATPYIHPLERQSKARMNQNSLEMCTESLGSETGSSSFDGLDWLSTSSGYASENRACQKEESSVNYHCSVSRRSPPRSFPPPLPSISRPDGSSIHMRPHRRDGRLVVEAIPIPSHNYLHATRHNGRLLVSRVNTSIHQSDTTDTISTETMSSQKCYVDHKENVKEPKDTNSGDKFGEEMDNVTNGEETEDEDEDEEEEEEVEVVDRGTIVEVKVSTQPQQQNGTTKVLRSSIVINKFVGGTPLSNENRWTEPQRQTATTRTTAAAAAVAISSVNASTDVVGHSLPPADSKLLFTSKRRNRDEVLHNMRLCSELRRALFFWEPCCIDLLATQIILILPTLCRIPEEVTGPCASLTGIFLVLHNG